jgi:hypothetical protein
MAQKRAKFSNGTGCDAELVKAVNLSEETFRVFLKNAAGDSIVSMRCADMEAALAEIKLINDQLGW